MDETGKKLLNLMFREGERICVSPNKYGYHCVPLASALDGTVTLIPTPGSCALRNIPWDENAYEHVDSSKLLLVALNPIEGFREDVNCVAFRNFLVELDTGPLNEQILYVKKLGMPYSASVFSGGKSIHFLISLDEDLKTEERWRYMAQWILNVATMADPNCKNPSRSIRIPGAYRDGVKQRLLQFNGHVTIAELTEWLNKFPNAQPQIKEKREVSHDGFDFTRLKPWVINALTNGLDPAKGRNKQWFAIACDFALAGYNEDDTLDILSRYFSEDRDFKEREWKTAIRSGFKYVYENR